MHLRYHVTKYSTRTYGIVKIFNSVIYPMSVCLQGE